MSNMPLFKATRQHIDPVDMTGFSSLMNQALTNFSDVVNTREQADTDIFAAEVAKAQTPEELQALRAKIGENPWVNTQQGTEFVKSQEDLFNQRAAQEREDLRFAETQRANQAAEKNRAEQLGISKASQKLQENEFGLKKTRMEQQEQAFRDLAAVDQAMSDPRSTVMKQVVGDDKQAVAVFNKEIAGRIGSDGTLTSSALSDIEADLTARVKKNEITDKQKNSVLKVAWDYQQKAPSVISKLGAQRDSLANFLGNRGAHVNADAPTPRSNEEDLRRSLEKEAIEADEQSMIAPEDLGTAVADIAKNFKGTWQERWLPWEDERIEGAEKAVERFLTELNKKDPEAGKSASTRGLTKDILVKIATDPSDKNVDKLIDRAIDKYRTVKQRGSLGSGLPK